MSDSITEGFSCPNPDCRISETGKCVEGFDIISECPNQKAKRLAKAQESSEGEFDSPAPEKADVQVGSGETLSIDEATGVLCQNPTRVLTIIGPKDSGKTTLAISLYSKLQEGPFEHLHFGGSLTLIAFEQRCHDSLVASGRDSPDTPRTSRDEGLGFLHLTLHDETIGRIDLLISERSGEFYKDVADSKEECKDLYEIDRADLIIFLVDGKQLATDQRHVVKSNVIMMVETLCDGGILKATHKVGIVLTKYDEVLQSEFSERAKKDFGTLVEDVKNRYGSRIPDIQSFIIAARPAKGTVPPLYGVLDIFEECLRPQQLIRYIFNSSLATGARWFFQLQPFAGDSI